MLRWSVEEAGFYEAAALYLEMKSEYCGGVSNMGPSER